MTSWVRVGSKYIGRLAMSGGVGEADTGRAGDIQKAREQPSCILFLEETFVQVTGTAAKGPRACLRVPQCAKGSHSKSVSHSVVSDSL